MSFATVFVQSSNALLYFWMRPMCTEYLTLCVTP